MDAIAVDDLRKDLYLQTGSEVKTGEKAKGDYPHWSWDRLNNAKEISYLTGSAMDAIAVDDLRKDLYLQTGTKVNSGYDHWTAERLGNSNATTWIDSSPMD